MSAPNVYTGSASDEGRGVARPEAGPELGNENLVLHNITSPPKVGGDPEAPGIVVRTSEGAGGGTGLPPVPKLFLQPLVRCVRHGRACDENHRCWDCDARGDECCVRGCPHFEDAFG